MKKIKIFFKQYFCKHDVIEYFRDYQDRYVCDFCKKCRKEKIIFL